MVGDFIRVFIIERPGGARPSVKVLLDECGLDLAVESATSLQQAMARLRSGTYDVLVVDPDLPDRDGFDVIHEIRSAAPLVPIVVMSETITSDGERDDQNGDTDGLRFVARGHQDQLAHSIRSILHAPPVQASTTTNIDRCSPELPSASVILDASPVPMVLIDASLRVRVANRATAKMFGRLAHDLEHRLPGDAMQCLKALDSPDGCGLGPTCHTCPLRTAVEETLATGEPRESDATMTFQTADGIRELTLRLGTTAVETRSGRAVLLCMEDIGEQEIMLATIRESEARYRSLFERNLAGVFRSSIDGSILDCNPAMARILGCETVEQATRLRAEEVYSNPRDREGFLAALVESGSIRDHQVEFVRRDGSMVSCLENATLVAGPDGEFNIIEGTAIDITARLQAEQQLHHAQKMEAVGRLAGGVAHDINNLLQAFAGLTHGLKRSAKNPEAYLDRVAELSGLVKRGASLTRQLLLFSRRESDRTEQLDLRQVVGATEKLLRHLLRENIVLVLHQADRPLPIEADQGRLEQVIVNLAVNAQDAMPGGGTLNMRTTIEGDRRAVLEVTDSGHGIPEEIIDKVFEPFFTTKDGDQGTGLGLSVVHGIVTQFGGTITVDSKVGRGTTICIRLPIRVDDLGGSERVAAAAAGPLSQGAGERILLVEDEVSVRKGLHEMLTLLGYRVETAESMAAALETGAETPFDLLITDLVLPDGNGLEIVEKMQANHPGIAAITISGYSAETPGLEAVARGDVRFIQKPVGVRDFAREVKAALSDRLYPPQDRPAVNGGSVSGIGSDGQS